MADRHDAAAEDTTVFVPLAEVIDLARAAKEMRAAQVKYFAARRSDPHGDHRQLLAAAKDRERKFDRRCDELIARERVCLPGMGGG